MLWVSRFCFQWIRLQWVVIQIEKKTSKSINFQVQLLPSLWFLMFIGCWVFIEEILARTCFFYRGWGKCKAQFVVLIFQRKANLRKIITKKGGKKSNNHENFGSLKSLFQAWNKIPLVEGIVIKMEDLLPNNSLQNAHFSSPMYLMVGGALRQKIKQSYLFPHCM